MSCSLATALASVVHILMIRIIHKLKGSHSTLRLISIAVVFGVDRSDVIFYLLSHALFSQFSFM